jgi:hypothetical protein
MYRNPGFPSNLKTQPLVHSYQPRVRVGQPDSACSERAAVISCRHNGQHGDLSTQRDQRGLWAAFDTLDRDRVAHARRPTPRQVAHRKSAEIIPVPDGEGHDRWTVRHLRHEARPLPSTRTPRVSAGPRLAPRLQRSLVDIPKAQRGAADSRRDRGIARKAVRFLAEGRVALPCSPVCLDHRVFPAPRARPVALPRIPWRGFERRHVQPPDQEEPSCPQCKREQREHARATKSAPADTWSAGALQEPSPESAVISALTHSRTHAPPFTAAGTSSRSRRACGTARAAASRG